jgi:DNA-binding LytR/AlgR family response regulator
MNLRVVAIDDEPLALQRLEWCLRNLDDVELVGKARDGRRGVELIRSVAPDVVLLDIEMPELNGFEVIEALRDGEVPEVVFVTAFDHFAVQAFATGGVDYLLKPVEQERLKAALERARVRLELRDARAHVAELRSLVNALRQGRRTQQERRYESELWVREGDARVRVPVVQVERIEADGDYVRLHVGQRVRLLRAKLGELAEQLDPRLFIRVHRSEIVRHDLVAAIRRQDSGRAVAVMSGGREIPISKRYLAHVVRALRLGKHDAEPGRA